MSFPVSSTPMTRHHAATYTGRMSGGSSLAVIVELHLPAPVGAVSGVPEEDLGRPVILLRWPQGLPCDSTAVAAEPSPVEACQPAGPLQRCRTGHRGLPQGGARNRAAPSGATATGSPGPLTPCYLPPRHRSERLLPAAQTVNRPGSARLCGKQRFEVVRR
jgi:hypothetical protein